MFRRDAEPDAQRQIGRVIRRTLDLGQFFERIERKRADTVRMIRFPDRFFGLDRVHETQRRRRQKPRNKTHFGDRCNVEMGNAGIPQRPDEIGRGVCLYGIDRAPRKLLHEESGSAASRVRADQRDRLNRTRVKGDTASRICRGDS
jgi:hypothetical protein